jgi:sensor domain CHASE-containing protein
MDQKEELEQERTRRIQLEQELANWHAEAAKSLTPEHLAATIQRQQIETLTYHLLLQRKLVADLEAKASAKDKDLSLAVGNIKSLESELSAKIKELERLRKETDVRPASKIQSGQKFSASWIPTDDELDTIMSSAPAKVTVERPQPAAQDSAPRRKDPKSFKDFIQFIRRMERVKLFDAALIMDTGQDEVMQWAEGLQRKGYVVIEGLRDKTIVATEKMLKTK